MEAPEFYNQSATFCSQFSNDKPLSQDSKPSTDHFIVEDLLDFSNDNDDDALINDVAFDSLTTDSSTATTALDSCNSSSFSGCEPTFNADIHFSGDLCVPYDDLAELEWLSNFVEESFSSDDLQKLHLISGIKARPDDSSQTQPDCNDNTIHNNKNNNPIFHPDMSVPAKARSKRSRAAPCNWASRLLLLSPSTSSSDQEIVPAPPQHPITGKKTVKVAGPKRREGNEGRSGNGEGRKCLHCATDKTPQWRTGPMGPKTLCNACGVRYKSGRLVPEYRPAASPTFVLTKHSNSHRKVMELRRQKEMVRTHQQQYIHHHQNMVFDVTNGDDYLIHQHVGPDFRQLI
ncbi:GATA transcription factor 12 [Euphorbia lathyris]|uniref:GATA transcription factor 12 n=1 Tax=Euphorbia lathyris TaxID=212925 RepID=UPI0033136FB2